MSTNIPGRPTGAPAIPEASTTSISMQNLPQEMKEHICSFISVRERRDINSFAVTDKFFAQQMQDHREASGLVRLMDDIRLKGSADANDLAEVTSLFEKTIEKFHASPSLRRQLFRELLAFASEIRDRDLANRCCSALWDAIPKLPEEHRADAITTVLSSAVPISASRDPFPDLELAYQYVTVDSDKPRLIGFLSLQLAHCSELDFPATLNGLLKKIDKLPPRERCEALSEINAQLICTAWKEHADFEAKEVLEAKYQQVFAAAYERIAELPLQERIAAIGAWNSPTVWNGDHRTRDQMVMQLLRLIPSSTPATDQNARAIAQQIASNFNNDARLHTLARFRTVLDGIAHLSAPLQAYVLEHWCRFNTDLSKSGDLQWQAISEVCERLPDPEKGRVLTTLANNIGMVGAALHWDWESGNRNVGSSAEELARSIERSRHAVAAEHRERHINATVEYYASTSFSATASLNTLLRLARNLPLSQRIEILTVLLDEDRFDDMYLRTMSTQEKEDAVRNIRNLIATVSEEAVQQSLKGALDTMLAKRR